MPRQCPGHRRRGSSSWNPCFTGDPASPAQRTDGQAGAGVSGGLFQSCRHLARGAALPRPAAPCPVRARRQVWRAGHPRRFGPRVQCGPSSRVSVPQALSPGVPASWKSDSTSTHLVTSEFPRAGVAPLLAVGSGPPGPEGVGGTAASIHKAGMGMPSDSLRRLLSPGHRAERLSGYVQLAPAGVCWKTRVSPRRRGDPGESRLCCPRN